VKKFVIIGLPRTGTTYLFTLLNSHPQILCHGERFNVYRIIESHPEGERETTDRDALRARDMDPATFFDAGFDAAAYGRPEAEAAGFKVMLGQDPRVLFDVIPRRPDVALIYVRRDNKLAQVASHARAKQTKQWADTGAPSSAPGARATVRRLLGRGRGDAAGAGLLDMQPRRLFQLSNEAEILDRLFLTWLEQQPHPRLVLEYRELFAPGFEERICAFLGLPHVPGMASPLVKQNAATVLDRFRNRGAVRGFFSMIGRKDWLGREL
jgi:hypothetical protein